MSMPSSPRVPMSPESSRRRVPRPKDKRQALRSFYGIQQNQNTGPVVHDPILDGPDFSVDQYLEVLNKENDIKGLLKLENSLIRDIRVLDGERKALVYDNYGRMISATETIKKVGPRPVSIFCLLMGQMTTELAPMTPASFEPILKSISDLTPGFDNHDSESANDNDGNEVQTPEDALKEWVRNGLSRITQLVRNGAIEAAKAELEDVQEQVHILDESEAGQLNAELERLRNEISQPNAQVQHEATET